MYTLARRTIAALFLPLMVLAAACSGAAEAGSSVELTAADSGRTIHLRTSDELVVTLDSNASTGFRWMLDVEPNRDVLALVDSRYVPPETDLVGAGGTEVWTFRAAGEGTTRFELRYERSSGETAGKPFVLTVEVASAS
ncbi:MAG TPA: protease inhibitor I42 family protein [Actinomycetota bacterium]